MGIHWRDFKVEPWDMLLPVWKQRRIQLEQFAFIPSPCAGKRLLAEGSRDFSGCVLRS